MLRLLQMGERISLPRSRPVPLIGYRCRELRIDEDAIVILDVFEKKTQKTPKKVIDNCKSRIRLYEYL